MTYCAVTGCPNLKHRRKESTVGIRLHRYILACAMCHSAISAGAVSTVCNPPSNTEETLLDSTKLSPIKKLHPDRNERMSMLESDANNGRLRLNGVTSTPRKRHRIAYVGDIKLADLIGSPRRAKRSLTVIQKQQKHMRARVSFLMRKLRRARERIHRFQSAMKKSSILNFEDDDSSDDDSGEDEEFTVRNSTGEPWKEPEHWVENIIKAVRLDA